jgi:disulfide bond formation protein DsbB
MNFVTSFKQANFLGAIIAFIMIISALAIQLTFNLEPCPLCITQRIIFIVIGALFILFALLPSNNAYIKLSHLISILAAGLVGVIFSIRHILIQAKIIEIPAECGIDLDYMFKNFPFTEAVNLLFKGTGDCSQIDWTFFGITLPQMALLGYIFFITYTIYIYLKVK